jgi:flavin-dependent dehydrogenase
MKTDIIIAGGGAAGSMAAWLASEADFDVTLLEKRDRYHYKPCSGVFPLHAFKHFPKMPESWFER